MADQERQRSRSSRPRHPSERSIEADAQRREQLGSLCDAALQEADALLVTLRELQLISKSSRPDRRTIAFAVASLRGELPAERSAQAAHFGLHVDSLRRARADWVDDEDERLRQAMAYRALTPDEVHTPPLPARAHARAHAHAHCPMLLMVGALRTRTITTGGGSIAG